MVKKVVLKLNLSLVVPVFNEEAIIKQNIRKIIRFLDNQGISFEILIGNDGSTDNTAEIVRELAQTDKRISVFNYPINRGKGLVLSDTFPKCEGDILAFIDSDLEIDISYLIPLTTALKNHDIAIGSKLYGRKSSRMLRRNLASLIYNSLARFLLKSDLYDHQIGIKAFKREALFDILPELVEAKWLWDTEILVRAQRKQYKIAQIPVNVTPTRKSKIQVSKYGWNMLKGIANLYTKGIRAKR